MNASIPPPPPAITPTPPVPPAASASATPPPPPSSTHSPSPQPLAAKVPGKKRKRSSYDNKELKKSVTLCDDGKYRWIYELSMWKNPTLLVLIYKVLGIAFGIVGLFILILNWENLSFAWEDVWPVLAFIGFFALLTLLAYAIVAGMYGGKYIVIFTMDERGINHEQIPEQAAKARTLGAITAAAGAATSNPSMAGLGAGCAARTSMYSTFSAVRSVKPHRGRNLIKLRESLSNNQVYVRDEDFDFVHNYIKEHCPRVK